MNVERAMNRNNAYRIALGLAVAAALLLASALLFVNAARVRPASTAGMPAA